MRADRFPLLVGLSAQRHEFLVVGGGPTGERKVRTLLDAGCRVHLVSPDATETLRKLADDGTILWERRKATQDDFTRHHFSILALPPEETLALLPFARQSACLVNCASIQEESDWSLLAQFGIADFRIGVGTGGASPAAAARLKARIRTLLEWHLPDLAGENADSTFRTAAVSEKPAQEGCEKKCEPQTESPPSS